MIHRTFLTIALVVGFVFSASAQNSWNFDKSHSRVGFSVSYMLVTDVEGHFKDFGGKVNTKGDSFENATIDFWADAATIYTDNEKRDAHLQSDDFFNAAKYPKLMFKGKSMKKVGKDKYKLTGDMTIRDVTKTVMLDVVYNGTVKGPWGNTRAGFTVRGELNRFDYDLKWNKLIEAGGAVVGKDVELLVNIQLIQDKNGNS